MRSSAIAVSGLRRAYGDKVVLDGIDLDVSAGTVFSLLGPNGEGKTTTVLLDQGRLVAQGTPDDLKRQVPGTHVRLRFTTVPELAAAARVLTDSTRDDEAPTLRVPSDGGTKSLRALLDKLDEYSLSKRRA